MPRSCWNLVGLALGGLVVLGSCAPRSGSPTPAEPARPATSADLADAPADPPRESLRPSAPASRPPVPPPVRFVDDSEPLSEAVVAALDEALADERRARAFYQLIAQAHAGAAPFDAISLGAISRESALVDLYVAHGLGAPIDTTDPDAFVVPATIERACEVSVEAERNSVAMYERLLVVVAERRDVSRVFASLRDESRRGLIPVLQRAGRGVPPVAPGADREGPAPGEAGGG